MTAPPPASLAQIWREPLRQWIVDTLSRGKTAAVDYDAPPGDPGLFGPDTVTWRVHSDFPGMMAGGVCALMLQTLHPLALAGVWDHSNFREDLLGRLRRTTAFVAVTTYAPRAAAQRMIERVVAIHAAVRGTAPGGLPYHANDPDLLAWVHATEMWSFLKGYERYRGPALRREIRDRYYDETARVAEALGARGVPRSQAQVEEYFRSLRSRLEYGPRSAEVLAVLRRMRLPSPAGPVFRETFLGAGAALLPAWASTLMGRSWLDRRRDQAASRALSLVAPAVRSALAEGVSARSCRRMGLSPEVLNRFPNAPER